MFSVRAHFIQTFVVFCIVSAVLLWLSVSIYEGRENPIEYESEIGKVVQVHSMKHHTKGGQFTHTSWYAKVVLADGNEVIIPMIFQPAPKEGDKVPLLREVAEDDSRSYVLDRMRWQVGDF